MIVHERISPQTCDLEVDRRLRRRIRRAPGDRVVFVRLECIAGTACAAHFGQDGISDVHRREFVRTCLVVGATV
jgi:hypothetical protein